ncbi:MAG TPA: hypothetical protein VKQ54_06970 [Caulobacteraceae bacterium]|jgi:uncharacterized membrane protein|nr:hypothetical protein [Caulobacteraceae bacterium]
MTQSLEPPPPPSTPSPLVDERQMALIIYILFLAPLGGLTHLIGVIMAYVARDSAPAWLQSHYTYLIRTFWMGLLYFAVALVLCVVLIGIPLLMLAFLWFIVRCAVGLMRLFRSEPIAHPETWTI